MNVDQSRRILATFFVSFVVSSVSTADAQLGISWHTIDSGGGFSSAGNFELEGTIGQHDAGPAMSGGAFSVTGGFWDLDLKTILLGDVNGDGIVNLLDVAPFVDALTTGNYIPAADINQDGVVNLLDVGPFVDLLTG